MMAKSLKALTKGAGLVKIMGFFRPLVFHKVMAREMILT